MAIGFHSGVAVDEQHRHVHQRDPEHRGEQREGAQELAEDDLQTSVIGEVRSSSIVPERFSSA